MWRSTYNALLSFNKAIDDSTSNEAKFSLQKAGGERLPFGLEIRNNDALVTFSLETIQPNDTVALVVEAGVVSSKALPGGERIELHRLNSTQRLAFFNPGNNNRSLVVDSVTPRRLLIGDDAALVIAARGINTDDSVAVSVGSLSLTVNDIQSTSSTSDTVLITVSPNSELAAGLHDLKVTATRDGVTRAGVLRGALVVDAPLSITSVTPAWGPVTGGTTITLTGTGFEPGNTVIDGTAVTIGDVPVSSIRVLSTREIEVVSRAGSSGRFPITMQSRNGERSSPSAADGFGYGLRQIASREAQGIHPAGVWVDEQSGVAYVASGSIADTYRLVGLRGAEVAENAPLALYDVQAPENPVLTGGVSSWAVNEFSALQRERRAELLAIQKRIGEGTPTPAQTARIQEIGNVAETSFVADGVALVPHTQTIDGVTRRDVYLGINDYHTTLCKTWCLSHRCCAQRQCGVHCASAAKTT